MKKTSEKDYGGVRGGGWEARFIWNARKRWGRQWWAMRDDQIRAEMRKTSWRRAL